MNSSYVFIGLVASSEDNDVPEAAKNDEKNAVFTAEPAIIIDVVDADSSSGNSKGNV